MTNPASGQWPEQHRTVFYIRHACVSVSEAKRTGSKYQLTESVLRCYLELDYHKGDLRELNE